MKSDKTKKDTISRLDFVKKASMASFGALAITSVVKATTSKSKSTKPVLPKKSKDPIVQSFLSGDVENIKLRMQDDIRRALKKPVEQRKWAMVIDLRKCVGCNACTVACIAENSLPPGVVYRPVIKEEVGEYPNVSKHNFPKPCMQCSTPPCTEVCPVGATFQRPDGIVEIDYKKCIGCRYCLTACPYEHRVFDFGEYYTEHTPMLMDYEKRPSFEYGKNWPREDGESPIGNARKCTYCLHRLEAGSLPQCVSTCIGGANYFGDLNDPNSVIAKIYPLAEPYKPEFGTNPTTRYIH